MIDILNTDPRFTNNDYFDILIQNSQKQVQDIYYLFSKSIPFTSFAILFFEVPMWSTRFGHPKVTTPRE